MMYMFKGSLKVEINLTSIFLDTKPVPTELVVVEHISGSRRTSSINSDSVSTSSSAEGVFRRGKVISYDGKNVLVTLIDEGM